jgi:hypothetical protein
VEAGLGPVGLGHRNQLGDVDAVGGGLADQGGGGLLVAVAGGRDHGQPQPMPGRRWPNRLGRWWGRPQPVAIGIGGWFDGQVSLEAAQGLLAALGGLGPGRAPGKTSVGRQLRARATMA